MAEENNAGVGFFLGGKDPVVIGVQQANNDGIGSVFCAGFQKPERRCPWGTVWRMRCDLNRTMMRIVMVDETTNEADHDVGRSRSRLGCRWRGLRARESPGMVKARIVSATRNVTSEARNEATGARKLLLNSDDSFH